MSSEFNSVQLREKYADFNGKIKEQMPLLLADNRYPMFTRELAEQRVQGRGIGRYVDTGDLGTLGNRMTQEQVLNHKGWRILLRHPDEVPVEFAEDFEGAKEYIGKVVFSRY